MEGGTLQQLRNLIGRRNIGLATEVKGHVNEIEDFLELVIRCHLVAAALHFFSMSSTDDHPHSNAFPDGFSSFPAPKRKKVVLDKLLQIVDRYVIPRQFYLEQPQHSQQPHRPQQPQLPQQPHPVDIRRNPHYQVIAHEHSYSAPPPTPRPHRLPSTITQVLDRREAPQAIRRVAVDGVYNYASAVLNDGLLLLEFRDAIREGDGPRVLRCWKAFLLYFHSARHQNYAAEAIRMLSMVNASATPRVAAQVTWSRVVNTRGLAGHNIPVDLMNEHLNRALKDAVAGTGPNIAQHTILQCGRSLDGLQKVTNSFDRQHGLHPESVEHSRPSLAKDERLIIEELSQSKVFDYIPGREHRSFRTIKANAAQNVNLKKLTESILRQKSMLQSEQNVSKLYHHSC